MVDQRCPMCGKPNSDDLVFCGFCGARMKPLISPSQQDKSPSQKEGEQNIPAWRESEPSDVHPDSKPIGQDSDDWLERLRAGSETELGPESARRILGANLSEWRNLQETSDWDDIDKIKNEELDSTYDDSQDWLSRLQEKDDVDEINTPAEDEKGEDKPTIKGPTEMETGDWLEHIRAIQEDVIGDDESEEPSHFEEDAEEIDDFDYVPGEEPEWLGRLTIIKEPEPTSPGEIEAIEPPTPEWVEDGLDTQQSREALSSEEHPIPYIEESVEPEGYSQETPTEVELQASLRESSDETPDAITESIILSPSSETEDKSTYEDKLDAWFAELDEETLPPSEISVSDEVLQEEKTREEQISDLTRAGSESLDGETTQDVDEGAIAPFLINDKFDYDILDVEKLPQWLTPESDSETATGEFNGSELAEANIPGWLDAIRPVNKEIRKPRSTNETAVHSGPLAGLSDVLPLEPDIVKYKKPPAHSAKLQITPTQVEQAKVFQDLLLEEGNEEVLPETTLFSPQRTIRWLIALIMIIFIGYIVIKGSPIVPNRDNTPIPASTYNASKIVNQLPNQSPVLIGFDYEAGTNGEMQAAAVSLINDLLLKNARITLVSTKPTGPALAENFIKTVEGQQELVSGEDYINLGFIPGSPAGLKSFAQTPQYVFPLSYTGIDPWNTQVLTGISRISDFSLVVVVTNNSDTARIWIEQVQPLMQSNPLLTILSAQAEPLVRPYYGSESTAQVKGIISGITGGTAYEVAVGDFNLGSSYWGAFSYGLFAAVCVILCGGIYFSISWIMGRGRDKNGGRV